MLILQAVLSRGPRAGSRKYKDLGNQVAAYDTTDNVISVSDKDPQWSTLRLSFTHYVVDMSARSYVHTHTAHDDVIKWKHFPRYWPFVRGIHRSPVNSPHKGQWRGALMFSLICAWINGWVNNREAGDLRRHRAHYDVTVMNTPVHWKYVRCRGEDIRVKARKYGSLTSTCLSLNRTISLWARLAIHGVGDLCSEPD